MCSYSFSWINVFWQTILQRVVSAINLPAQFSRNADVTPAKPCGLIPPHPSEANLKLEFKMNIIV